MELTNNKKANIEFKYKQKNTQKSIELEAHTPTKNQVIAILNSDKQLLISLNQLKTILIIGTISDPSSTSVQTEYQHILPFTKIGLFVVNLQQEKQIVESKKINIHHILHIPK